MNIIFTENVKERKLTNLEQEWINDNKSNIVSFNVPSDLNVFGKDGKGVFYDYLDELSNKYDINVKVNSIGKVCRGEQKSHKGFHFEYVEVDE